MAQELRLQLQVHQSITQEEEAVLVGMVLPEQDREAQEERVEVEREGVVPPQEVLLPVQTAPMVVVVEEVVLLDHKAHLIKHLTAATAALA